MLPLKNQVYIAATDGAKGCGARLAGAEIPKYEDTETSFAELEGARGQDQSPSSRVWTARPLPARRARRSC